MFKIIIYIMCMSIGFILSGCNQSLTDLSKYPPIHNSDEKYLYNRFNQKILVYNTNLNTVVKEITENNFFQYEFPQQTDIYISGHSFDNDFEVLKITDKKIQSLLKLKKNEGVFPVANNENYHIMIRSFYDSNNIEIENLRILCGFDSENHELFNYENTSGLITKGVIDTDTLYYTVYNKDIDSYSLYSLDLTDTRSTPLLNQENLISDDLLLTSQGIWISDNSNFYNNNKSFQKDILNYVHPDKDHIIQIGINQNNELILKIYNLENEKYITEVSNIVDFQTTSDSITIYGNGFQKRIDLK